ncbi:sensor domain-containing protein [Cellulomonas alba]|uniref:Sensor domain-containing protein n=1 Tax=Cellulomonas alba TaxID=3053467 RepID=A0ABT7SLX3_9CELL|nr:sensor domain-containing protein [Cellulomonas alba]MDM7856562.1 sensor domain-containing protein [Cellulomonas alba]
MSGTDPRTPDARGRSRWWWVLAVVAVVVGLALLVVQPWEGIETEPQVTGTHASETTTPATPSPTPTETTPAPPPGSDARFDAKTLATLFVPPQQLVADVPAAAPGVVPGVTAGSRPWGLPAGSTVTPSTCTTAVTVVAAKPAAFDARSWTNPGFAFEQSVTLLPTPAAAQTAFSRLVTTIDACPTFTVTTTSGATDPWDAQPAIEGQGVYPSIVQQVLRGTAQTPGFHGQMLVGNAIVTWTASAPGGTDTDSALATLGDPLSLSAMVQKQAVAAVATLP